MRTMTRDGVKFSVSRHSTLGDIVVDPSKQRGLNADRVAVYAIRELAFQVIPTSELTDESKERDLLDSMSVLDRYLSLMKTERR